MANFLIIHNPSPINHANLQPKHYYQEYRHYVVTKQSSIHLPQTLQLL